MTDHERAVRAYFEIDGFVATVTGCAAEALLARATEGKGLLPEMEARIRWGFIGRINGWDEPAPDMPLIAYTVEPHPLVCKRLLRIVEDDGTRAMPRSEILEELPNCHPRDIDASLLWLVAHRCLSYIEPATDLFDITAKGSRIDVAEILRVMVAESAY